MLSIVIPTHNRKNDLSILLSQIKEQALSLDVTINIIVVVDGSTDGTCEMLTSEYPEAHMVHGDGSLWYTRSMNEGFKYALTYLEQDYILTLNDDVELSADYLDQVSKAAEKSNGRTIIGSLGVTISKPHQIVTSGNRIRNKWLHLYSSHIPFLKEVDPNRLQGLHPSVTLPGRGMLIPVNVLKALNCFDEKFKQYHSDGDFTLRALRAGYEVKISWDATVYVNLEKTSNTTSFLNKSLWVLIKSFYNPVSRNYLPDKARIMWRHGHKLFFPIKMILFIIISFRNISTKNNI